MLTSKCGKTTGTIARYVLSSSFNLYSSYRIFITRLQKYQCMHTPSFSSLSIPSLIILHHQCSHPFEIFLQTVGEICSQSIILVISSSAIITFNEYSAIMFVPHSLEEMKLDSIFIYHLIQLSCSILAYCVHRVGNIHDLLEPCRNLLTRSL